MKISYENRQAIYLKFAIAKEFAFGRLKARQRNGKAL
jgi:hypothetical protein